MIPLEYFLILGAILFAIGAYHPDIMGQVFVIMTITVAAAEVAVGIAILLNAYKMRKTTELDEDGLTSMRW